MATKSSVLLPLFCINYASGIILPGPCPFKKPTHLDWNLNWTMDGYSIAVSVPFATRKSNLFRDIRVTNYPHCHSLIYSNGSLQFRYGDSSLDCQLSQSIQVGTTFDNNSIILNTQGNTHWPGNCSNIQEIVRIWVTATLEEVFIWSCEELKSGKEHDEALLSAVQSNIEEDDDDFADKVIRLAAPMSLFLDQPLLERIIFPVVRRRQSCIHELDCYTEDCNDAKTLEYQWIIYGSVIIGVGLYLILNIVQHFIRKSKQTRVAVIRWAW